MKNKIKTLCSHHGFLKYLKNTSWLFTEKILRIVSSLFVGVWVARYLGPERFGLFNYSQSFVGLFAAIATFGLDGIVIRELVKDESKKDILLGTAFVLKLIGAFLVISLVTLFTLFNSSDDNTNLLIFVISSALIFQSLTVIDFYFQSKVRSKYVVFTNIIGLIISSLIKVVLILNKAPLIFFAFVIVIDSVFLSIGLSFFYHKKKMSFRNWGFRKEIAFKLLKNSWPIVLSGIAVSFYMRIDQVMIREMVGNEQLGQYAAAVRLSEMWYFIPTIIVASLFPAIINAKKQSSELYDIRIQRLYSFLIIMSVVFALPMTLFSNKIVVLLYGKMYSNAGEVLMVHIWAGLFVSLGVAGGQWLLTENLQIFSSINTAIGAIINILLNFILLKTIGIKGAAWATLIAYFFAAYLSLSFYKKTRKGFYNMSKSLFVPWRIK